MTSLLSRALTPALCVLGGDLSFLFPARGTMGAERSAHFLAFCSFSAESLYYNPWMLALPAGDGHAGPGTGAACARAAAAGSCWPPGAWPRSGRRSSSRACRSCWACGGRGSPAPPPAPATGARIRRAPGSVDGAEPGVGSDPGAPRPLRLDPLYRSLALAVHPSWHPAVRVVRSRPGARGRWPAGVAAALLVALGGLGVRLVGAAAARAPRAGGARSGAWTWLGMTMLAALLWASRSWATRSRSTACSS